jgi:hypothetical protein
MKIALVGQRSGSHIGGSLERAARGLSHEVAFYDTTAAFNSPAVWRHFHWRLRRRPPRLKAFSQAVEQGVLAFRADLLLATGLAPLEARALQALRAAGVECVNYLTDDPWNPAFKADWLFEAIASYDRVYSPRRANLDDLRAINQRDVGYLPFGYDHEIFCPGTARRESFDLVFAGGADPDRLPWFRTLLERGYRIALFGGGWQRHAEFRACAHGLIEPAQLKHVMAAAAAALCIVRRANRDGHAMRSFELPAMRVCMLAEDTAEHRELLGDTVAYFSTPDQLTEQLDLLLGDPQRRDQLAHAAHTRIVSGSNTYVDRLESMLARRPAAVRT